MQVTAASEADILACQFHRWYGARVGEHLASLSLKSVVLPLPAAFMAYLSSDGIVLPSSAQDLLGDDHISDDEDSAFRARGTGDDHDRDASNRALAAPTFSELTAAIASAIEELGGEVCPKTNWSAPLDAVWMNGGSLKCRHASEVYLLLKASDRVIFDFEHMFDLCHSGVNVAAGDDQLKRAERRAPDTPVLVLRKWANLNPGMEFRLFVMDGLLVGACQRDCTAFYEYLVLDQEQLEERLCCFFEDSLQDKLPLRSCAVDVYVDRRSRVYVVDVNPFGEPTGALLFEWTELLALSAPAEPLLRVVRGRADCLASALGAARGPVDVTQAPDFYKFMQICKQQHGGEDE